MTIKPSTGTAQNNEYKTDAFHEARYSGIHQTVKQIREEVLIEVVAKCKTRR
jgi:hypothetical protein